MNSYLACIRCGSQQIECGDSGAPSHCAACGGDMVRRVTVEEHAAKDRVARHITRRMPKLLPGKASQFFAAIHEAIDRAA